jgi:ABC-type sugar transport system ATPase subunit
MKSDLMSADQGLVVSGLTKWYGATRALSDVNLEIRPGRVVALIGHNGAGKSTLLRALSGAEIPDEGAIKLDGRAAEFRSPAEATAAGIACVYQELSLINELTVAENIFLGAEMRIGPMLDRRAMNREADQVCAEFSIPARATDLVAHLPVAQRQLLEVARAIHRDAKYLLLDEPTTALEQSQIDDLLGIIRRLSSEKNIGILLIDHKLDEVYAVANQIVGLANGEIVLAGDARTMAREDIIEAIVGAGEDTRRLAGHGPSRDDSSADRNRQVGGVVFEVRGLADNGLAGVDLKVFAGEVLGIYGLVGSGRSRFLRTVYGAEPAPKGAMFLRGKPFKPKRPDSSIGFGVAFLSEERKSDGFIPQMTSIENIVMPVLDRYLLAGLLKWNALRHAAAATLRGVSIRGDVHQPITSLSGGNQQKALFARAILQSPDLLLLDEPTKGVDIGAKAEIYEIIRRVASEGRSVIVVSSEEEELLEIADRIVVFRNGACDGKAIPETDLSVTTLRRHAWTHEE